MELSCFSLTKKLRAGYEKLSGKLGVENVPGQVDLAKLYVETLTQAEAGPEEARFQRLSKWVQIHLMILKVAPFF